MTSVGCYCPRIGTECESEWVRPKDANGIRPCITKALHILSCPSCFHEGFSAWPREANYTSCLFATSGMVDAILMGSKGIKATD